jgi:hypothetical protein
LSNRSVNADTKVYIGDAKPRQFDTGIDPFRDCLLGKNQCMQHVRPDYACRRQDAGAMEHALVNAWMARSCMSPSIRWRLDGCCSCVRECLPAFKARPLSLTSHLFSRRRPLEGASVSRMCSFPLWFSHGMSTVESLSRAEGESSSPGVWHGVDRGFSRGCAVDPEIDGSGGLGQGWR